jgi:hypothetical protein
MTSAIDYPFGISFRTPVVNILDYAVTGNETRGYPFDASPMILAAAAAAAALPFATLYFPHADARGYYYNSPLPIIIPQTVIPVADPGSSIVGGPLTTDCFHFTAAQANDGYPVVLYGEITGASLPEILYFSNGRGVWWDGRNGLLGDLTVPRIGECNVGVSADSTNGSVALKLRAGSIVACNHGAEMVNHQVPSGGVVPNGFQGFVIEDCYFHGNGFNFYMDFPPTTYPTAYNGIFGYSQFDGTFTQISAPEGGTARSVGAALNQTNGIFATAQTTLQSEYVFEIEVYSDDFSGRNGSQPGVFISCPRLEGTRLAVGCKRVTGYGQWITGTIGSFVAANTIGNRNRLSFYSNNSSGYFVPAVSNVGVGPGRAAWNGGSSPGPYNDVPLLLGGGGAAVPAGIAAGGVVSFFSYHLFANGASTVRWTPQAPLGSWAVNLEFLCVTDNAVASARANEVMVQYMVKPGRTTDGTEQMRGFVSVGR